MALFIFYVKQRILCGFSLLFITWAAFSLFSVTGETSPSCTSPPSSPPPLCDHHHRDHVHHDNGHHHHPENQDNDHYHGQFRTRKLPEELAEEEDLAQEGFNFHPHSHPHHLQSNAVYKNDISPLGIWIRAMGCSLLVSMASLICLIFLPLIFFDGKPSRAVVDCLAVFGAGAMLGDAFLHQLPHAFGDKHSHSDDDHIGNFDDANHSHGHSHAHSLEDLSIGLSVLFGVVLFFLVEKIVRYVEDHSESGANDFPHVYHHHNHQQKLKYERADTNQKFFDSKDPKQLDVTDKESRGQSNARKKNAKHVKQESIHKRTSNYVLTSNDGNDIDSRTIQGIQKQSSLNQPVSVHQSSNLVLGYLNLFSDGVHNFTDGMALGSAFLLHGSVGGWSRTLFLLAHELPQEVGDFGILVRSGFSVSRALFFNFLSALVALAGTALALVLGKDPGQSSLIEGFTAGGFIYIAAAGVLPEMHDQKSTIRRTIVQLASLLLGMALALCISLVE